MRVMAVTTEWHPVRDSLRLTKMIRHALRSFRDALRYPAVEGELDSLSEHYLRDVGIDSRNISKAVEAEITGISLLDTGWVKPRGRLR
jgi:uncharacterized protein YjiS (DUF1127 family)